jgi:hypothetical protein
MTARPVTLIVAAMFLLLIGASGMAAGGGLLGVGLNNSTVTGDVRQAGLGMGGLMAGYGLATILAGVGLLLRRRWAWRLGLFAIVLGLVALGAAVMAVGQLDPILLFGVAIWGLTFACLLARSTRSALAG